MDFYTNVYQKFDIVYVRGYINGKRFNERVKYEPYLFEEHPEGDYKTIDGSPVRRVRFDSISSARKYQKLFEEVENKTVYGITQFAYLYIYDQYGSGLGNIKYDQSVVSIVGIDIEVAADQGFPDIKLADKEITAITMRKNGKSVVLGCGVYRSKDSDVTYVFCKNETELLNNFIRAWNHLDPDIVTGWNIEFFDMPYIVNRITRILGEGRAKELSPWKIMEEREIENRGNKSQAYLPAGITILDYMKIYKKFSHKNQESYSLNNIAAVELKEKKIDYSEYTSLLDLYKKDYEKFIDYNIHDVILVDKLEEKLGYIKLVMTLAYNNGVNYIDTLATVRPWDILIHGYLMDRKIVVPPNEHDDIASESLIGGYVKEPHIGMHDWVVSFDLNSLYMHLVMQYNISADTFIHREGTKVVIDDILDGKLITPDFHKELKEHSLSMTANMCFFTKNKRGFLPEIAEKIYTDRTVYKKKMIEAKKEFERTKDPEIEKQVAFYKNFQDGLKVMLNSGYGAIANKYFRWYSFDRAEAITSSGQLSIRWIEKKVNEFLNKKLKTKNVDYVIASDTDSIYVNMKNVVDCMMDHDVDPVDALDMFCKNIVQPFIDASFKELAELMNAYEQKMAMKREKICSRAIWKAAKMYVLYVWDSEGVRYKEPEVEVTGIESVRSSTPLVAREWIKETLKLIMSTDEETVQKYIAEKRKEFMEKPFDQIAFPRSVKFTHGETKTRSAGRYTLDSPALPIQVRAALLYNKTVKDRGLTTCQLIGSDDKIKFTYLKTPNPIGDNVIGAPAMLPKELGLDDYIDYEMQFAKSYLEPIRKITDIIGWQAEKVATLESFF